MKLKVNLSIMLISLLAINTTSANETLIVTQKDLRESGYTLGNISSDGVFASRKMKHSGTRTIFTDEKKFTADKQLQDYIVKRVKNKGDQYLDSLTSCHPQFTGRLGLKSTKMHLQCTTINKKSCDGIKNLDLKDHLFTKNDQKTLDKCDSIIKRLDLINNDLLISQDENLRVIKKMQPNAKNTPYSKIIKMEHSDWGYRVYRVKHLCNDYKKEFEGDEISIPNKKKNFSFESVTK